MTCNNTPCIKYSLQDDMIVVTLATTGKDGLLSPQNGLIFREEGQETMLGGWYKPVSVTDRLESGLSEICFVQAADEAVRALAVAEQAKQAVDELSAAIEKGLSV